MVCVIIDSGLNLEKSKNEDIIGGVELQIKNDQIITMSSYTDDTGHGSACYDIIRGITKYAKYFVIKISTDDVSNLALLEEALRLCLKIDCNIISISMTIDTISDRKRFREADRIIKRLIRQNKIVVSSMPNSGSCGYPACNINVVAVPCTDIKHKRKSISNQHMELMVSRIPQFTSRENKKYYLFGGNSKATAQATGYIINNLIESCFIRSRLCNCFSGSLKIKIRLREDSLNEDQCEDEKTDNEINDLFIKKIKHVLIRVCGERVSGIKYTENLFGHNIINKTNLLSIVTGIENEFGIQLKEDSMTLSDFQSILALSRMVRGVVLDDKVFN